MSSPGGPRQVPRKEPAEAVPGGGKSCQPGQT
jgi:hypothetical protein